MPARANCIALRCWASGTLVDAIEHISDAMSKLPGDAPWAVGDAYRVLGDIRSAMGDDIEALEAYERSYALGWDPQPGHGCCCWSAENSRPLISLLSAA